MTQIKLATNQAVQRGGGGVKDTIYYIFQIKPCLPEMFGFRLVINQAASRAAARRGLGMTNSHNI
ncbi:hypothetical protein H3H37_17435 [Duganella sp. LX20W]|uniref:Uncharacterized protein n=1 Tax=Rugamonas brunnea TaxID=2758569 RepID=A0A7W2EUL4_9BURK|nr:hypothetical protein [Rugamonas brunnea]MBA5638845.1 hypothetical protein [Rugamonas brunnea]